MQRVGCSFCKVFRWKSMVEDGGHSPKIVRALRLSLTYQHIQVTFSVPKVHNIGLQWWVQPYRCTWWRLVYTLLGHLCVLLGNICYFVQSVCFSQILCKDLLSECLQVPYHSATFAHVFNLQLGAVFRTLDKSLARTLLECHRSEES